jgi:hypothetical protein
MAAMMPLRYYAAINITIVAIFFHDAAMLDAISVTPPMPLRFR